MEMCLSDVAMSDVTYVSDVACRNGRCVVKGLSRGVGG